MTYTVNFDLDFERHTLPGKFIVLEGIDGSGKTTQAELVVEQLKKQGKKAIYTKEPTDGTIGKFIREVLSGKVVLPSVAFQYLFAADRSAHQAEIKQYLQEGYFTVSDRYFWSAIPYGIADRDGTDYTNTAMFLLIAQSMLSMYNQFLVPDKTLYLELPVSVAVSRLGKMDKEKEIYEQKEKLEKIAKGYEWLAQQFPKEFTKIDATKSVGEVTEEIVASINVESIM